LRVLLDVALVDQRHGLTPVVDRILQRRPHEPLARGYRDRLYPDPGVRSDLPAELVVEDLDEAFGLGSALFDLEAGVDVLGVLPEDDHVDQVWPLHGRWHPLEPADRAQADVKVEDLAQRHVERAEASADRRRERAFDPDQVLAESG